MKSKTIEYKINIILNKDINLEYLFINDEFSNLCETYKGLYFSIDKKIDNSVYFIFKNEENKNTYDFKNQFDNLIKDVKSFIHKDENFKIKKIYVYRVNVEEIDYILAI